MSNSINRFWVLALKQKKGYGGVNFFAQVWGDRSFLKTVAKKRESNNSTGKMWHYELHV